MDRDFDLTYEVPLLVPFEPSWAHGGPCKNGTGAASSCDTGAGALTGSCATGSVASPLCNAGNSVT